MKMHSNYDGLYGTRASLGFSLGFSLRENCETWTESVRHPNSLTEEIITWCNKEDVFLDCVAKKDVFWYQKIYIHHGGEKARRLLNSVFELHNTGVLRPEIIVHRELRPLVEEYYKLMTL